MGLRRLEVNLDALVEAMTVPGVLDAGPAFLDLRDGSIRSSIEGQPGADLREIPRVEAREQARVMERFAKLEGYADPDLGDRFRVALAGESAASRFHELVGRDPALERRWLVFEREADRERALDWLESIGIEAIATAPPDATMLAAQLAPAIALVDLLMLGGPGGKTELLRGKVHRMFVAASPDEARGTFEALARELAQLCGVPWREAMIGGQDVLQIDRYKLALDGVRIELEVETTIETWRKFRG